MAADRASAEIRERSVLYAYCVRGIRAYVRPHPPASAAEFQKRLHAPADWPIRADEQNPCCNKI